METKQFRTAEMEIGVVGLGLMGSSIIVALLIAGHPVKAIAPIPSDMQNAAPYIRDQLMDCDRSGLLKQSVDEHMDRLTISEDYAQLRNCSIVMECVIEIIEIKEQVYEKILLVVDKTAIIASNTSAIPISELQRNITNQERFLGIHWAEPAFVTRFLEITCGHKTAYSNAERVLKLAYQWDKEPTLLRKDIRGFITNRLMYAVYRELFHLVDKGHTTLEDVDKAFRYDAGSWITLMGVFRRMDFIGLADSTEILKTIFPTLCNSEDIPPLMQKMIDSNARGTQNLLGLYDYTLKDAKQWEEAFATFNKDIYELASFYPLRKMGLKEKSVSVL